MYQSVQECDAGEYEGYIEQKGVCLCAADDLTSICNLECRIAQQQSLTFVCASAPLEVHLQVKHSNGTVLVSEELLLFNFIIQHEY